LRLKHFIRLTVGFLMLSLSLSALLNHEAQAKNIQNAAQNAGSGFNKNALMDAGAAVTFGTICKTAVTGGWACPLAVASAIQAAQDAFSARQSYNTSAASLCEQNMIFCDPTFGRGGAPKDPGDKERFETKTFGGGDPNFPIPQNLPPAMKAKMAELATVTHKMDNLKKELAAKGYAFDPATGNVNTPKGPVDPATAASPEGMAALGLTKEQAAEALATIRKVTGGSPSLGYESGGGSIATARATDQGTSFNMNAYMNSLSARRKPASADFAGLKKLVGNEPIGLAGDNIFDMVSRQYKTQAGQGAFLP
jgi:hypothetical protein